MTEIVNCGAMIEGKGDPQLYLIGTCNYRVRTFSGVILDSVVVLTRQNSLE